MSNRITSAGQMITTIGLLFVCGGCMSSNIYHPPQDFTPKLPTSAKVGVAFNPIQHSFQDTVSVPLETQEEIESKILSALKAKGYEPIDIGKADPTWMRNSEDRLRLLNLAHDQGATSLLVIPYLAINSSRVNGPDNTYIEASHLTFLSFGLGWFDLEGDPLYWEPHIIAKVSNMIVNFEDKTVTKNKRKFFTPDSGGTTTKVPVSYISQEEWLNQVYERVSKKIPQYN